jgi:outer membrane protein
MQLGFSRIIAIAACGSMFVAPGGARAETLAEAIALAYGGNPTLQQQRAQQRALDENYVQAAAGLRPTAQLQLVPSYQDQRFGELQISQQRLFTPNPATHLETNGFLGQVVVTQPLYTGGRVTANIATARSQIAAGRQQLRSSEGDLLLNVVNAYTSVRRDTEILQVEHDSIEALRHQLDEATARKAAGDATLTDVAQAEAELENQKAAVAAAAQQLEASRAFYFTVVGQNPETLEPEPPLPDLPGTVDEAFSRGEANNPELKQAELAEKASAAAIAAARAANMPNVSLQASVGDTVQPPPFLRNITTVVTAEAVISQPLYVGGLNASNIRRAVEQNNADRLAIEVARRQVVQNIANAWNGWLTATANEVTQQKQVTSAQAAYDGMQIEYRGGLRTSFDVLFAEETLTQARVLELEARHDAYFYAASVLRYTGSLEADIIAAGVPKYDPVPHAKAVERELAPPWDPLVQMLDRVGAPSSLRPLLTAPPVATAPTIVSAAPTAVPTTALARTFPTTPLPGTAPQALTPSSQLAPPRQHSGCQAQPAPTQATLVQPTSTAPAPTASARKPACG